MDALASRTILRPPSMRFSNEISVDAPPDELFEFMSDPEKVVTCLPGASVDGREGDDWRGAMSVKVGPIKASYQGTLRFLELDADARRAVMRARADEASGQGQAEARITSEVEARDGASCLRMETDLQIRGKVAQFGRGAMEQVAGRMLERFADNVEQAIRGETPGGGGRRGRRDAAAPARPERGLVGARRRRGRLRRRLPGGPVPPVKAADFDYYRVDSLEDALERLGELGEDAKVLAGGQSLVPMMNFRLARPAALVDITRVEELRGIERDDGVLRIRAATTHAEVEHAAELEGGYEVMRAAAQWVGHEPIRSRGTFGGSLAHADPTAEWCLIAVALGAVIEIAGPCGERELPAEEFLLGYFTTALEPDEIVTAVRFPAPCKRAAMQEFARRHGDFALVAVAVALPEDGEPRIVLGGVGDVPVRAREAERLVAEGEPFEEAARAAAAEIDPGFDLHASPDYRRRLAATLVRRALEEATGDGR